MRLFLRCVAVALTAALFVSPASAQKVKGALQGIVTEVKIDAEKNTGTVTVVLAASKKGGADTAGTTKTYKVTATTKVERAGKKGAEATAAKISDVTKGSQISIVATGDEVTTISLKGKK